MKKAIAVQEAILTVGIAVIGITLLATQVPSMISDIQESLSRESVNEIANELASLLSIITSAPNDATLTYSFPTGKSYDVIINDGDVTVSSGSDKATAATFVYNLEFSKTNVQLLTITKTTEGAVEVK